MKPSTSKFVELESISLKDLFSLEPGSVGLYIPVTDSTGSANSIRRISSHAKSFASRTGKACEIHTLLTLKNIEGIDIPQAFKIVQVTTRTLDGVSDRA